MQIEEPIDFPEDESVAISDAFRSNLYKMLRGTNRIIIEEEVSPNKYKKVNAIRLTCKSGRMPDEQVDDICETIMQIVHLHWLASVEEAGDVNYSESHKVRYRVAAVRPEGRTNKRVTYSFFYSTDLDEEDKEEMKSVEHEIMQDLLDSAMRQNDQKGLYIEHLHETILDTIKANNQPLSSAGELLTMAGSMATAGLTATLNALKMQYDSSRAEAEEKGKTARMTAVFNTVAPFLGIGIQQFLENKLGKKVDLSSITNMMQDEGDSDTESGTSENEEEMSEEMKEAMREMNENPIAFMCRTFGESLTPKQQLEMNKKLSKKQVEGILDVAASDTDKEAVEKIEAMRSLIPTDKYPTLLALLTAEQQQMLLTIVSKATE